MRVKIVFVFSICVLLASCKKTKEPEANFIRPVKVATVEARGIIVKDYAGVVEAVNFVKLAFRVSGQIINLPVVEGQRVEKGQLIAEIDPRDLVLQYAADKAAFETARSQLERNERLLERQAISLQEYEISQANYQKTKSTFDLSANNLRDARLYAPFAGSIEKKLAENYQRIMSGVPVVQLIDTRSLQIRFTVPDNNLYLLQGTDKKFTVEFETYKGHFFNARLKEYLDASPDGSGIPVTIVLDDPSFDRIKYDVKPGFTCNVNFNVNLGTYMSDKMTWIPLSAVFADPQTGREYVWVVDNSNTVHRRRIEVYSPSGESNVLVSDGLKAGEKIVTAGVYRIIEGEKVKVIL